MPEPPTCPSRRKYYALSQSQARRREFDAPYVLISIQDPGTTPIELGQSELCLGILRLQFDDAERSEQGKQLFTREQAREVLGFVAEYADEFKIVACHCKMGVSRSPAVVAALSMLLEGYEDVLTDARGRPKYHPNRHVYDTLIEEGRRHPISDLYGTAFCTPRQADRPQASNCRKSDAAGLLRYNRRNASHRSR